MKGRPMEPKTVEKLERTIEEAIRGVIAKMGLKKLPLLPSYHTVQMMAKDAVTVYETAVEKMADRRNDARRTPI